MPQLYLHVTCIYHTIVIFYYYKKMYGSQRQRFAGRTQRAPDALLTLVLDSALASQVNSQRCICWTSETGAAADAREPILGNLLVNFRSHFDLMAAKHAAKSALHSCAVACLGCAR